MPDESKLSELLVRWEELRGDGQSISAEELCAECPDLAEELERRIAALESVRGWLDTSQSAQADTVQSLNDQTLPAAATYRPIDFHAKGGIGEVYRAHDEQLRREVALKVVQKRFQKDDEGQRRFLIEAQVTGKLDHPGVVPVYGVGRTADGRPFYTMRFVDGETLHEAVDHYHRAKHKRPGDRSLAFRQLLTRFAAICNTIAYAHNRGILHLDIKPSNIVLGKYGETLVVDWGLAQRWQRDSRARRSGERTLTLLGGEQLTDSSRGPTGTPPYMSPEQAEGDPAGIGPASDIYGLGATLYRIITGENAFSGRTVHDVVSRVKQGEFAPPRQVRPELVPALEAICLKAMARDPHRRYSTALELADEIEHLLADEPVAAYEEPRKQRLARWARRHRVTSILGPVAILLAMIGVGLLARRHAVGQSEQVLTARILESNAHAARLIASAVDRNLDDVQQMVERVATSDAIGDDLRKLLSQTDGEVTPEKDAELFASAQALTDRIHEDHRRSGYFNSWLIADRAGTVLARTPMDRPVIGRKYAYREWFTGQEQLAEGETGPPRTATGVTAAYVSTASGNPILVAIGSPVRSEEPDGEVIGVVQCTISLTTFTSWLEDSSQETPSAVRFAVLLDHLGQLIHHPFYRPNPENGLRRLTEVAAPAPGEEKGKPGITYSDPLLHETYLAGVSHLPKRGWTALVQERRQDGLRPVSALAASFDRLGTSAVVVCLGAVALLWYAMFRATRKELLV